MRNFLKPLLAGSVLCMAAAGQVSAAICEGSTGSTCGSGELFVSVWNPETATSYSLDLGITIDKLINDNVASKQWNLADTSIAPLFGDFLSALAAGKTLQYNVAGNNTFGTPFPSATFNPNFGVATTFGSSRADVQNEQPNVLLQGISGQMSANLNERIGNLNSSMTVAHPAADSTSISNLDELSGVNEFSYFDDPSWGIDLGGGIGFGLTTTTEVGQALDFYLLGFSGIVGPVGPTSRFDLLGTLLLDKNGMLTFTSVSAIPLPAAGWLLGSALLGVMTCGRRGLSKARDAAR